MTQVGKDTLGTRSTMTVGGKEYAYYSLAKAAAKIGDVSRLPFSMKVLLARVAAVVRRPKQSSEDDTVIKAGPVALNVTRYEVSINGKKISPTATEFRILAALLRGRGRVFSRSQLLNQAFGENVIVTDRTIDVHVTALRKKLGNAAKWLQTVRGVGYTFREPTSN